MREETVSEHIARDIREGRFPEKSEPQAHVDTSDEACAIACMLVSNPQGTLRQDGDGWQKRVNDLIRALRDERNDYRARMCKAIDELSYADLRASGGIQNSP